ncbi:MAG: hypothetical protein ACYTG5_22495 [Planctomycetota bacterium]|jgi:predicted RNase H-like nuclease (RuvC/YqgF family)
MIVKAILVGVLATSGAVVTIQNKQDPQDPRPARYQNASLPILDPLSELPSEAKNLGVLRRELSRLQGEVADLGEEVAKGSEQLEEALRRAEAAELRNRHLEEEREYCQEMHTRRNRGHRNCTPSRSMLVKFDKALNKSGNEGLAKRIAQDVAETVGDKNSSLNSYTWALLTKSKYKGKHDDLALMLAERMASRPRKLNHYMLDTIALAKFRSGFVDEAIALQERALEKNCGNREYKQLR